METSHSLMTVTDWDMNSEPLTVVTLWDRGLLGEWRNSKVMAQTLQQKAPSAPLRRPTFLQRRRTPARPQSDPLFAGGGANSSIRPACLIIDSPSRSLGVVRVYIIVVEPRMSSPNPHALKNNLAKTSDVSDLVDGMGFMHAIRGERSENPSGTSLNPSYWPSSIHGIRSHP